MSRRDSLTNLLNRTALIEAIRKARREGTAGVVLIIDIDLFKLINDKHGHAIGDEVIRALADRLRAQLPPDSLVGRYGGEEFVAFVPVALDRGCALAHECLAAARAPIALPGSSEVRVTVSIGVASLNMMADTEKTLSAADLALFAAKQSGRDRVQVFDDDTKGVLNTRRSLAAAVASLQERNQELQQRVEIDALTGLRNRHALEQVLPIACGGHGSQWPKCSVAFLDIDHFGKYNKLHGDSQGDLVLKSVAQTIRGVARKDDLVFRKGGEEMVVVLPNASHEEAQAVAERMRSAVEGLRTPHKGSEVASVVTVTVGIASAPTDRVVTVQQLMQTASDMAMKAKVLSARNRVHVA
jgi:diguanylate cyclase (GGDEF)-like protein